MPLGELGERCDETRDIQLIQIDSAVFFDNQIKIGKQFRVVVHSGARRGEAQQPVGKRRRILLGDSENHIPHHRAGFLVEPAGHAEVDQNDFPTGNDDIARMRVGMEESLVQHLSGIIIDKLGADFLEIIAFGDKRARVRQRDAVNVIHDDNMLGAQVHIRFRAVHIREVRAESFEFLQVARLEQEIRFRFEGVPQLFDDTLEVDDLRIVHDFRCALGDGAHDGHVLRHGFAHARTLHFDSHVFAGQQGRAMHLRERSRAERG